MARRSEELEETPYERQVVLIADYIAFGCLIVCAAFLHRRIINFKGPTGEDHYFMGYREEKVLPVLINIFAAIGYWSRITARISGGGALELTTLQYVDYLATCPLVTVDMLWSLNLPYKFTYGAMVFLCILCAFACDAMDSQARWMWFGLGMSLFAYVWINVGRLVLFRFTQLAFLRSKDVLKADIERPLKVGSSTFFFLWFAYPLMWLLEEFQVMSEMQSEVAHVVFDVVVKSVYALFMQEFCFRCDRTYFEFPSMSLTAVPTEEYNEKDEEERNRNANEELYHAWQQLPVNSFSNQHRVPSNWHFQSSRAQLIPPEILIKSKSIPPGYKLSAAASESLASESYRSARGVSPLVGDVEAPRRRSANASIGVPDSNPVVNVQGEPVLEKMSTEEEEALSAIPEQNEDGIEISLDVSGVRNAVKLVKEAKSGEANTPPEARGETPTTDKEAGGGSEDVEAGSDLKDEEVGKVSKAAADEIEETRQEIEGIERTVAKLRLQQRKE